VRTTEGTETYVATGLAQRCFFCAHLCAENLHSAGTQDPDTTLLLQRRNVQCCQSTPSTSRRDPRIRSTSQMRERLPQWPQHRAYPTRFCAPPYRPCRPRRGCVDLCASRCASRSDERRSAAVLSGQVVLCDSELRVQLPCCRSRGELAIGHSATANTTLVGASAEVFPAAAGIGGDV